MGKNLDIRELADTRQIAAREAGVAEDVASEAFDAIRAAGVRSQNAFDVWAAINEQIGKTQSAGLQKQLIELRTQFEKVMVATAVSNIEKEFSQGPEAGWIAWLTNIAEGIARFRIPFVIQLCDHDFPFTESNKPGAENVRKAVRCIFQYRWPEAFEQIAYLSQLDFLAATTRAKLCVIAGQIQLYHFMKPDAAKWWFDTAERLAPDNFMVLSGVGDYWVVKKDFEKARSYYDKAIKAAPEMANGYSGMGDCAENEKQLDTARKWHLKAIEAAPGDSGGYGKLFKLYGRPENFKEHEQELQPLMQRALTLSPEDEYQLSLEIGYCYEQNERLNEAQSWYERAISIDPERPTGYTSCAQLYFKLGRKDQAEAAYKEAIRVAPECYEGYWGLTAFYEQQQRWQETLKCYQQAPQHPEEFASIARAKVCEMQWQLQNYRLAEDILKRELRAHKDNETAKNVLLTFAADYYKNLNDKESATRLYRDVLEILNDDSNLGDYHNWLGNMHFFLKDYTQAAAEYSAAIAAKYNTPVFHRNLHEAYKELKDYSRARQSLKDAFQIDNSSEILNREMALLVNAEANDHYGQGDYQGAIKLYQQAIGFDATNDVIFSNLGGAFELLKEPGKRAEALENAIKAYQSANKIRATEKYERGIARLQFRKEWASRYGENAIDWLHVVTPIGVEVANDLIPLTVGSTETSLSPDVSRNLVELRARVLDKFGVKLPGVRIRGNEGDLPPGSYLIMINEIPLVMGTVEVNQRFFPGSAEVLKSFAVEGKPQTNPLNGEEGFWISEADWGKVEGKLELWDAMEFVLRHLQSVIQHNLFEFLGHQEVMEIVQDESQELAAELRTSPAKLSALTSVCRSLVTEGVPIKPFSEVFEAFNSAYSPTASLQQIVESVRSLPAFRLQLPGNNSDYQIVPLGPHLEGDIRNSIYQNGGGAILAMEPESCQSALSAVRNQVGLDRNIAVVVEDAQLRPYVRLLLELEFPNNPVLSRHELRSDVDFKTMGLAELEKPTTPIKPEFRNHKGIEVSTNGHENGRKITSESKTNLTVFLSANLENKLGADNKPIEEMFSMMQDGLFYELGIVLPTVKIEIDNSLKEDEFRFILNGAEYGPIEGLKPDEFLVNDVPERLRLLNVEGRQAFNPANGNECAIVAGAQALDKCVKAGLTIWGPAGFLVLALSAEIHKKASTFQTLEITNYILETLQTAFPELIAAALKRFSVEQICLVLQDLLDEEISIRDLRTILESMLSIKGTTDVDLSRYIIFTPQAESLCPVSSNRSLANLRISDYSDFVRTSLKRYISHKYTRGSNTLIVYLLDPAIEKRIRNVPAQPLTSEESDEFKQAVRSEVGSLPSTAQNPVLLTTMDARRPMRKLIEKDFPYLAVLSYQELSPDMNIQPIARISLD